MKVLLSDHSERRDVNVSRTDKEAVDLFVHELASIAIQTISILSSLFSCWYFGTCDTVLIKNTTLRGYELYRIHTLLIMKAVGRKIVK